MNILSSEEILAIRDQVYAELKARDGVVIGNELDVAFGCACIDAALIKAGRKAAPEPVRHVTIAGVDR